MTTVDGCPECTAQWNAVAVVSVAFQAQRADLADVMLDAFHHGLTVADLSRASGLGVGIVGDLLAGVQL